MRTPATLFTAMVATALSAPAATRAQEPPPPPQRPSLLAPPPQPDVMVPELGPELRPGVTLFRIGPVRVFGAPIVTQSPATEQSSPPPNGAVLPGFGVELPWRIP